jgi:hypothetical protein
MNIAARAMSDSRAKLKLKRETFMRVPLRWLD